MAIDRTGISSLDAGASDITYSGNQGPKSPQEKRMVMAKSMGYSDDEIMEYENYRRGMEEGKPGYPILEIDEYFKSPFGQSGPAEVRGPINPTYTQKRKQSLAGGGIAGLKNRPGYFLGSLVDKIKDDIIPNEIKDNPILSAAVLGGAVNQFGLPDWMVPDQIAKGSNVGQNWIGSLLENITGSNTDKQTEILTPGNGIGGNTNREQGITAAINTLMGGNNREQGLTAAINALTGNKLNQIIQANTGTQNTGTNFLDYLNPFNTNFLGGKIPAGLKPYLQMPSGTDTQGNPIYESKVNPAYPIAGGALAYEYAKRNPGPMLPADTARDASRIDLASAIGGDNLRFKVDPSLVKAAQGGRIGYAGGGLGMDEIATEFKRQFGYDMSLANPDVIKEFIKKMKEESGAYDDVPMAQGGRIGYQDGGNGDRNPIYQDVSRFLYGKDVQDLTDDEYLRLIKFTRENNAQGGRAGRVGYKKGTRNKGYLDYVQAMNALGQTPMPIGIYNSLSPIMSDQEMVNMGSPGKAQGGRIGAQEGGLMDLGGMEKDYREEGGFVPIGGQERADDVPARLSKNEFVFTADAVRSAGGGDIDKGAEVMENVMEHLEQGGQVSEESQGLEGARNMFATAQRLEGVM